MKALTSKANSQISTSLVLKLSKIELFLIYDHRITVYPHNIHGGFLYLLENLCPNINLLMGLK